MISQGTIQLIKERASAYEVIGDIIKLKKEGTNYVGLCPFHTEKTPSFNVSPAKNIFKCFGCGKSGDAISFLREYNKIDFIEALKILANRYNVQLEETGTSKHKSYVKPPERLIKLEKKTLEYFENTRKITNNTLLRFKVSDSVEWMPKAKKEIPTICFNYYLNGELVNTKFRGKNKDFKMVKDAKLIFYNLDAIKDESEVYICEGEVDAMSLYEANIYNVVSVPNGAGVGNLSLEYLDNCWEYFADKKKIILVTDGDEPGYRLREELARRLGKERCFKVQYPIDEVIWDEKKEQNRACKDANEVLVHIGKEKLKEVLLRHYEYPIEGVLTVGDDLIDEINYYWENGYPSGIRIGIDGFDDYLRFQGGQFTMVTGIPGSGKSELIDAIMASSVINHGWKWGVCSFENQPAAIHATKIIQKLAGKSFAFRNNPEHRMSQEQYERNLLKSNDFFYFININEADVTLEGILEKFFELVQRKGVHGLLLDPWNYIESTKPMGVSETDWVSTCLTKIRAFCVKTSTHLFLVAHPTKLKKENGKYEVPTMYSISGSAHFFNKTDNGISVYRDFETNIVTVYIQKVRFEWNGKIGFCEFRFEPDTRQYIPMTVNVEYNGLQYNNN